MFKRHINLLPRHKFIDEQIEHQTTQNIRLDNGDHRVKQEAES